LTPRFFSGNCSGYRSVFSCQRAIGQRPGPLAGNHAHRRRAETIRPWWR